MKSKKWLVLALALLMVMAFAAGCGGGTEAPAGDGEQPAGDAPAQTVKIGFIGPLTGDVGAEGSAARNAFEMAFKQAADSGELPVTVEVVSKDDAAKPETGASAAQALVADADLVAVSGHWNSGVAEATIPIMKQSGIPMVIWGAIRETLTSAENYPSITRVCPTDRQENIPLAAKVLGEFGYTDIYIISTNDSYGQGNTAAFQDELAKYPNAKILGVDEVADNTNDFKAVLTKAKATNPQAVFYGGIAGTGGTCKRQMKELGMENVLFFGISGICAEDFITAAGDAAEGTFSIKPGTDPTKTEVGQKFLADYAAGNFNEPVGAFTPYAYDAAQVLIQAIKDCYAKNGTVDAQGMTDAITAVKANGLLGETSFDEIGQTTNPATYALVVQDGVWVPWEESKYAAGELKLPGLK